MKTVKESYEVGDIVYVDFGQKAAGVHTQGGIRPALVIIRSGGSYTVIPITSKTKKKLPTHLPFVCKKGSQIGIMGMMLCENTTTVNVSQILYYKGNFKSDEPNLWNGTINLIGTQLSPKYDSCARPEAAKFRRGNIVSDTKGGTYLIVSNEKSNFFGSNITAIPAIFVDRGRLNSLDVITVDVNNGERIFCYPLLWNLPKSSIKDVVEIAGRNAATNAVQEILRRIKDTL